MVICDAGLPIPPGVPAIDLAVARGFPSFLQLLQVILTELVVESYLYAEEMEGKNPEVLEIMKMQLQHIPCSTVSHETFKKLTGQAKVIVRTGECSPYANVILVAGVNF